MKDSSEIKYLEKLINKRRKKMELSSGNIIYIKDYNNEDSFGITISKTKYITLKDSNSNPKPIIEKISPFLEYYVAVVNENIYENKILSEVVKKEIGKDNILKSRYTSIFDFIIKLLIKINKDINKVEVKNIYLLKNFLLKNYGINKYRSTYTQFDILHKIEQIEELEKDKISDSINEKKEEIKKLENEKEKLKEKYDYYELKESNFLLKKLEELNSEIDELSLGELNEKFNELIDIISLGEEIFDEKFLEKDKILDYINQIKRKKEIANINKNTIKLMYNNLDLNFIQGLKLNEIEKLSFDFYKYISIFENNKKLNKIIEKIGRKEKKEVSIEYEISNEKLINEYFKEELSGIIRGSDIARVLPSELIYSLNKDIENIFYTKLLEGTLLCYRMEGEENFKREEKKEKEKVQEEKGAIIALIDTSGSMMGSRLDKARSVLVKTLEIAKKDKRDMQVILFGSISEMKKYEVDKKYSIEPFINFISNAYNGGTDFETPLMEAIDIVTQDKKYEYADVFMLTDGECIISKNLEEEILDKKKKLDLKIYTVILESNAEENMSRYCDEIINC